MTKPDKAANGELERGLGLKEAVALNMIEIVGIGPFVVSPLVIRAMGGPQALIAWLAGALLATLDGFVWSELGARSEERRVGKGGRLWGWRGRETIESA